MARRDTLFIYNYAYLPCRWPEQRFCVRCLSSQVSSRNDIHTLEDDLHHRGGPRGRSTGVCSPSPVCFVRFRSNCQVAPHPEASDRMGAPCAYVCMSARLCVGIGTWIRFTLFIYPAIHTCRIEAKFNKSLEIIADRCVCQFLVRKVWGRGGEGVMFECPGEKSLLLSFDSAAIRVCAISCRADADCASIATFLKSLRWQYLLCS